MRRPGQPGRGAVPVCRPILPCLQPFQAVAGAIDHLQGEPAGVLGVMAEAQLQLVAQLGDVSVQRAGFHRRLALPEQLVQLLAGDQLAGVAEQVLGDGVFPPLEGDALGAEFDVAAIRVKTVGAELRCVRAARAVRPAQQGLDPCHEDQLGRYFVGALYHRFCAST